MFSKSGDKGEEVWSPSSQEPQKNKWRTCTLLLIRVACVTPKRAEGQNLFQNFRIPRTDTAVHLLDHVTSEVSVVTSLYIHSSLPQFQIFRFSVLFCRFTGRAEYADVAPGRLSWRWISNDDRVRHNTDTCAIQQIATYAINTCCPSQIALTMER